MPYTAVPARVGRDVTFRNRDAYGNFPVPRTDDADPRDASSPATPAAPSVDARAEVLTTVFGSRAGERRSGYGVPNGEVARLLADAGRDRALDGLLGRLSAAAAALVA